ncbi:hypothetical protein CEXT_126411 [Caerostris extrusa]|uniref:Uncharacterized protein n=1 Tax=Caerostris extrusa TaxID=172846 RepID=A0AAV4NSI2_CAEEX|nr:hypothetical protein CEXT_126411 [Caerostris extrusa]
MKNSFENKSPRVDKKLIHPPPPHSPWCSSYQCTTLYSLLFLLWGSDSCSSSSFWDKSLCSCGFRASMISCYLNDAEKYGGWRKIFSFSLLFSEIGTVRCVYMVNFIKRRSGGKKEG